MRLYVLFKSGLHLRFKFKTYLYFITLSKIFKTRVEVARLEFYMAL